MASRAYWMVQNHGKRELADHEMLRHSRSRNRLIKFAICAQDADKCCVSVDLEHKYSARSRD
jgi:hypothetical protein